MWHLHQFSLCPFSRKVRLVLAEKGVVYELVEQRPWEAGDALHTLNAAGKVPVLEDRARQVSMPDSRAICEYLEESSDRAPMLAGTALQRAEIRRLVALFDENFYDDVTAPLMHEKYLKRAVMRQPPDSRALRDAMRLAHGHLDYIDWLVDTRNWLAGARMSLADLAAAAQISVVDYLGGIDWAGHDQARQWYAVFKSRPSFRPLLAERTEGVMPPRHYALVDA